MISDRAVIQKIAECVALIGGKSDILSVIASWGDTLSNEDVWNELHGWMNNEPNPEASDTDG